MCNAPAQNSVTYKPLFSHSRVFSVDCGLADLGQPCLVICSSGCWPAGLGYRQWDGLNSASSVCCSGTLAVRGAPAWTRSYVEGQSTGGHCKSCRCRTSAQSWATRSLPTWAKASYTAQLKASRWGMSALLTWEDTAEVLGWPKSSFGFSVKIKDIFLFSPRTLLNNVFNILFYYLLPFFRQLHNSIFPKLFIFLSKELFQVSFTVFQGTDFFSTKRIL